MVDQTKNKIKSIAEKIPEKDIKTSSLASFSIIGLLANRFTRFSDRLRATDKNTDVFRSGFSDLDFVMAGSFRKKSIYTVSGFPACGKSSFLRSLVLNFVHTDIACLAVSLQENAYDYTDCLICLEAGIEYHKFNSCTIRKRDFPKLALAAGPLSNACVQILANPAITIQEIFNVANELYLDIQKPLTIIIDDYYRLFINEYKKDPNASYATFSSSLRGLAENLNTAIIGAYPLPWRISQQGSPHPNISDFKEGYPLWEFSSGVILLYPRTEFEASAKDFLIEAIVAKNQYGPIGTIRLGVDIESHKISEMTQDLKSLLDKK